MSLIPWLCRLAGWYAPDELRLKQRLLIFPDSPAILEQIP